VISVDEPHKIVLFNADAIFRCGVAQALGAPAASGELRRRFAARHSYHIDTAGKAVEDSFDALIDHRRPGQQRR
jgi:hypothetical protein